MNENENEKKEQQEQIDNDVDLAKALNDMKANTVDKATYEKLQNDYRNLKKQVIDGVSINNQQEQKPQYNLEELRKAWQKEDQTNLEYIQNTLAYRKALIETGHRDPFLPFGKGHESIDTSEKQKAEHVAQVMQDCIDEADGNSELFTSLLNARMVDDGAILMALAKKNSKRR